MAARKHLAKASSSQVASAKRRKVFVERYLVNGNNAAEAARHAGYSVATAAAKGHTLINDPKIKEMLGTRNEKVLHDAQLTTERWAREMACIGHFDPGELYDAAGNLIPIHQLPEHVRRAIASVEVDSSLSVNPDKADGTTRVIRDNTTKIKLWDKNAALANIGKHLGMFEQDNRQRTNAIQVNVVLRG